MEKCPTFYIKLKNLRTKIRKIITEVLSSEILNFWVLGELVLWGLF